jgi:kinetochore protein Mis13/DSN1
MSMVLTRSPLRIISMNGAGTQKRRSARLSHEGVEDNQPPAKKSRVNGAESTTVSTKTQDGDSNAVAKRKGKPRKAYDTEVDGFEFTKVGKKGKETKQPAVRNSSSDRPATPPIPAQSASDAPGPATAQKDNAAPTATAKKARRRFPTTPEREAAEKPVRRSKRLSNENTSSDPQPSPIRPAHARSHAKHERSPSPEKARPVTVEKKRKRGANGLEEEQKTMRIELPFQDTPVIKRNREFRKSSAEGHRRSSSGMRGHRASSLLDEGRGNGTYISSIWQRLGWRRSWQSTAIWWTFPLRIFGYRPSHVIDVVLCCLKPWKNALLRVKMPCHEI